MKKIAVVVDNQKWCWTSTAKNTVYNLTGYEFTFFTNDEFIYDLGTGNDFGKYDLVWFRGYSSAALNEESVQRFKPKFISTVGTGGKALKNRLDGADRTAKNGLGLIVQNQDAYHQASRRGHENIWLIPNGVNTRLFFPNEKPHKRKKRVIGVAANTHGSRAELKGTPYIKKACEALGMEYKEVNAELPLSHESMAEWYRTLDYYLQPSHSEGCSNSVMEAMASGLPVFICKDVGYHGEICRSAIDYHDGQVIFVRRNEKDIEEKVRILEENPYIKERCIENALKFTQDHDWKHIAPKYKEVFDEVLGMKPKERTRAMVKGFTVGKTYYVECIKAVPNKGTKYIPGHNYILREAEYLPIKKYFEEKKR